MEAANAAHEQGHQVVLIEKEKELGGQLRLASIPPGRKEIEGFREFLLKRLRRTGVKVITGQDRHGILSQGEPAGRAGRGDRIEAENFDYSGA